MAGRFRRQRRSRERTRVVRDSVALFGQRQTRFDDGFCTCRIVGPAGSTEEVCVQNVAGVGHCRLNNAAHDPQSMVFVGQPVSHLGTTTVWIEQLGVDGKEGSGNVTHSNVNATNLLVVSSAVSNCKNYRELRALIRVAGPMGSETKVFSLADVVRSRNVQSRENLGVDDGLVAVLPVVLGDSTEKEVWMLWDLQLHCRRCAVRLGTEGCVSSSPSKVASSCICSGGFFFGEPHPL